MARGHACESFHLLRIRFMKHLISLRAPLAAALMLLASNAVPAADTPAADAAATTETTETIVVTATRLDEARNGLSPDTGSSIYRLSHDDLMAQPLGEATPLNQVMLQAPGVVGDSYGQLHVRGDHANLQYRINGVVIPEAITGFGQTLDTRFIERLDVLTGALPAQYGYRTAGIVDIHTKGTAFRKGGAIDLTGGAHNDREIGANVSGSNQGFSYFLSGSYLRNELGIENPTAERNALHDVTEQSKGFGYLSYVLDDQSRLSLMFGASANRFQIPDVPGQESSFALAGVTTVDSATLDANQREKNHFEVLSYQSNIAHAVDYQISFF